jgi:formiminotetrahydrofolate cyclodeaminase
MKALREAFDMPMRNDDEDLARERAIENAAENLLKVLEGEINAG